MFDHESGQLSYKVNLKREKMDGADHTTVLDDENEEHNNTLIL